WRTRGEPHGAHRDRERGRRNIVTAAWDLVARGLDGEREGGALQRRRQDMDSRLRHCLSPTLEMKRFSDRVQVFRCLHESGCFVIPNPWDVGSAKTLARLGFPALATTSSGYAWSLGRADNHVSLDEALAHLRAISQAVEIPVNADFEGGFATEPEGV